ncbi:conserved hypothetical protein [Ricinus communis]|uniref:Serine-threonine protein kinase, plant-type n=1 Tax=Ricinus communis TaxID=3988 RepID=B9RXB5_RICCO|nr:conserved hypothetical protein [Ricinus communis]
MRDECSQKGTLPDRILNCLYREALELQNNNLSGTTHIPQELPCALNLSSLKALDLAENNLKGVVSPACIISNP